MFTDTALQGKTILITGGATGLGFKMAERFASLGAAIAICGRTEATLKEAEEKLRRLGGPVAVYTVDVREYEQVRAMVEQLSRELGPINGLVNNAAGNFYSASEDLTPGGFKAVLDIVLTGSFNCSHCFAAPLIEAKLPGTILNIVTTYTETGSAFVLPSACAKAGVYAMTTTLAYEWATYGFRVNAIAPGPIPTKGAWERLIPDKNFEEQYRSMQPYGRFGEASELANAASFLMSDAASFVNGECLSVDGGERLRGGQFNFLADIMPRDKLKSIFGQMKARTRGSK